MRWNICAWTPPAPPAAHHCVPYVSVNREDSGLVTITVRQADYKEATVEMTRFEWDEMIAKAADFRLPRHVD